MAQIAMLQAIKCRETPAGKLAAGHDFRRARSEFLADAKPYPFEGLKSRLWFTGSRTAKRRSALLAPKSKSLARNNKTWMGCFR